jgi:hypothetical protein
MITIIWPGAEDRLWCCLRAGRSPNILPHREIIMGRYLLRRTSSPITRAVSINPSRGDAMKRNVQVLCFIFLAFCVCIACRKRDASARNEPVPIAHVHDTPQTDWVVEAWRNAGLAPEGFSTIQPVPYGAATCMRGTVQGVEALVCEFSNDFALDEAVKLLRKEWSHNAVGTGLTLRNKHTLLIAVDRAHHDPAGKVIGPLAATFSKQ